MFAQVSKEDLCVPISNVWQRKVEISKKTHPKQLQETSMSVQLTVKSNWYSPNYHAVIPEQSVLPYYHL